MTNKPEARRISKRRQARRQRKEARRIARELDRLYIAAYPFAQQGEPNQGDV